MSAVWKSYSMKIKIHLLFSYKGLRIRKYQELGRIFWVSENNKQREKLKMYEEDTYLSMLPTIATAFTTVKVLSEKLVDNAEQYCLQVACPYPAGPITIEKVI